MKGTKNMEINKQLFEGILSGKLKGTFVLENTRRVSSNKLRLSSYLNTNYPYCLNNNSYTNCGRYNINYPGTLDIVDFIPDTIEIDPEMYSYNEKDIQFIEHFINSYHMKENELTIEIPDNKIIDWDESKKQNKIVLKDKQLTYEDICNRLPGMIDVSLFDTPSEDGNALVANEHQLECLLAKNKLANVANYLNSLSDETTARYYIYNGFNLNVQQFVEPKFNLGLVMFKSAELAQQAVEILGEETVKLALEPLGI